MKLFLLLTVLITAARCGAQTNESATRLQALEEGLGHLDAKLTRQMNELLWFQQLGNVALVDKVRFTGQVYPGDSLTCRGRLTGKREAGGEKLVDAELTVETQDGTVVLTGSATAAAR